MKKGKLEMMQTFTKTKGMYFLKGIFGLSLLILFISGCNSSGGGSSSASLLEGAFVDSPVEGLGYVTETQSGVTDMNGTFMYAEGETVTFHVGDVELGSAMGQSVITPVDLVDGAVDETHPMVTNMARFLQTLDNDMDPENGITITQQMAEAMVGHMIDFNMDPGVFENDPDVQMAMGAINSMYPANLHRMMVSVEDAQNHLGNHMGGMMSNGMGDENVMEGVFVDSAVEGLFYETPTQSGITDMNGTFTYLEGETITFHVGDTVFGEAMAQSVMTPIDLVDGAVEETHPMVTNMTRFLQTLDEDMDPENGITITQQMADAMGGHMIEFNMDPEVFEFDSNVQMAMDAMNGIDSSGMFRMMVSIGDAQNHLNGTMSSMMHGGSGSGATGYGNGMNGTDIGMDNDTLGDFMGTDAGMDLNETDMIPEEIDMGSTGTGSMGSGSGMGSTGPGMM